MDGYRDHLEFATETALRAGRLALSHFQRPIEIIEKEDLSPVTVADRGAEALIRELIESAYPQHGILGEEMGETGSQESHRWIVDPIDGTRSFIHGVPLWGVLLGLEIDREMVVGVCYMPALDEMFAAAKGEGCHWNGRPCHVSRTSTLSRAMVCFTDATDLERRHPGFWSRLRTNAGTLRGFGDCYGHCLVASGRADAMLDPIMSIWDNAALKPIMEEAGGSFTDWSGDATIYGECAISTNGQLLPELQELIH
ncbi:MAG: inositol monophosphatase family protein [Gemmatimonadetes bacterium]|nr:inositol monophosphatase family protein [Gemmatimonadota bacterium]